MDQYAIREAIERAQGGITKYLSIMSLVHNTDVSIDAAFQTRYNSFYRVRQRSKAWYQKYYAFMQRNKHRSFQFPDVLNYMYRETGRYEPSFSSKLLATIHPQRPVWDSWVLRNINVRPPSYSDPRRLTKALGTYDRIVTWYSEFLKSSDADLILKEFDSLIPSHTQITAIKKVDFVLWQMRA